ncbi:MAG: BolA/IbaG family iron-sulfur metabolism protein [Halieaceae bacterium]|nr:BolA/IbaG family iron-sulfur metabolism protein [Halieaceae bacterium]
MNVEQQLNERLRQAFAPSHLELENESHQHSVPANSETHFRLVLVSAAFDGLRPVARHQRVYGELAEQLAGPVHALAMHLYTPAEWAQREAPAPESPACLGGSKADQAAGDPS